MTRSDKHLDLLMSILCTRNQTVGCCSCPFFEQASDNKQLDVVHVHAVNKHLSITQCTCVDTRSNRLHRENKPCTHGNINKCQSSTTFEKLESARSGHLLTRVTFLDSGSSRRQPRHIQNATLNSSRLLHAPWDKTRHHPVRPWADPLKCVTLCISETTNTFCHRVVELLPPGRLVKS